MKKVLFAGDRLFMKFGGLGAFTKRIEAGGHRVVSGEGLSVDDFYTAASDASAIVVIAYPVTQELLSRMERCEFVMTLSVGYDCVDVSAATERDIPVSNSPTYCSEDVANHAITLLLAVSRKLHETTPRTKQAVWGYAYTKPIYRFRDRSLGIIGLGKIGRAVVPKARGLGLRVSAYDPYIADDVFDLVGAKRVYELDELISTSDYVSIHSPLTGETTHLIDDRALSLMKPDAVLVNTSRGPIIDQNALVSALNEKRLGGAGIDVLEREPPEKDEPILACERAIVTPHIAWYSEESFQANMELGMDELLRVLSGKRPRYIVNPEIYGVG